MTLQQFFQPFLSSAALSESPNSIPAHSLMLSHLFFCLPLLLAPFTAPCRIVFAIPDDLEMWPYHLSFRFLTTVTRLLHFYYILLGATHTGAKPNTCIDTTRAATRQDSWPELALFVQTYKRSRNLALMVKVTGIYIALIFGFVSSHTCNTEMSRNTIKPTKCHVCTAKSQISLRICASRSK